MDYSERPINAPEGAGAEPPERIAHAALRGTIAAMAMSGMRVFTVNVGLVEEPPPRAIIRQRARRLLRLVPPRRRRAAIELAHWGYGAAGGIVYGVLPADLRRTAWSGPVYGLLTWAAFEVVLAPLLGLEQARKPRPLDRLSLAADHLLYGFVLSELRQRPRD
jgi:uncharacterized membrane protein YagU involved in acid resistance